MAKHVIMSVELHVAGGTESVTARIAPKDATYRVEDGQAYYFIKGKFVVADGSHPDLEVHEVTIMDLPADAQLICIIPTSYDNNAPSSDILQYSIPVYE